MRSPCALASALAAAADSYGCILGKSTPLQLVVLTILESVFFQVRITADRQLVRDATASRRMACAG